MVGEGARRHGCVHNPKKAFNVSTAPLLQQNSLARHRVRDWHCKGDGLEAVALTDAVLLTEGVVGLVVRRMVESASTVVLAERTIPITLRLFYNKRRSHDSPVA